ncbi:SHOCT domain-containing protein [Acholeplasma equirhinis]|uniref:SHOCT domain-containing protein n=1 Tax=Acholeplasma equirhinis TaxID=555393 RepID=UPI00197A9E1B|nr:SHOCT domain-containing protein [Acholeplasma equirhinis]MBN3491219.1 SHOCT domain-containing protein [Acholeplasma equirhinis]
MNKTYLTIAQVLAGVSAAFFLFAGYFSVVVVAFNIIAIYYLELAKQGKVSKNVVKGWSICLLFTATLAGILGLIAVYSDGQVSSSNTEEKSIETLLREIDELYEKGILSREEYESRRKKIIERV